MRLSLHTNTAAEDFVHAVNDSKPAGSLHRDVVEL